MRVAGSWPFQLWLTCTSACVCVLLSVCCPSSVLGCCHVLRSLFILPPVPPVCLCCYCVCWLQFTQIWPYCRQVSLLWEVLQWDPGQHCDPGGWSDTATDVSFQVLVSWWPPDYQAVSQSGLYSVEGNSSQRSQNELACLFFVQNDIKRSVWKEEKWHVRPRTVSTTCIVVSICFVLCDGSEAALLLVYNTDKKTHVCVCRFVECKDCGRKMHQICVLHYEVIWPTG